jgi:toxin-antitoxin system PIN domain toxin
MIVDANVLLYAADSRSPHHAPASDWLGEALTGQVRVGIPWQTVGAFVRIATHPRAARRPLTTEQAWEVVDSWLGSPVAWVPEAGEATVRILRDLMLRHHLGSAMTSDAQLAALAVEHGVPVVSADADFARFPEVTWVNPLSDPGAPA